MKKSLIAILVASTILAGCGESDAEKAARVAQEQAIAEQVAQEEAAKQQAAEDAELRDIVAQLKKGDPLVKDAYFGYNEKGERTLHIVRDNPPQTAAAAAPAAPGQPIVINQAPAASSGVSESIWPLAAGIGAGMLLANTINNNGGYSNYSNSHRPMGYNNYDNYDNYNRNRTTVINNYHTTTIKNVRKDVYKTPTYQARVKAAPSYQPTKTYTPNVKPAPQQQYRAATPQPKYAQPAKPIQTAMPPKPSTQKNNWNLDMNKSAPKAATTTKTTKPAQQSYWNQPTKSNIRGTSSSTNTSAPKTYRTNTTTYKASSSTRR